MLTEVALDRGDILATARGRALATGRPVLAGWTRPISKHVDPIDRFAMSGAAEPSAATRALWLRPSTGEALVGIGAARVVRGYGAERFSQVAEAWREILAGAVIDAPADARGPLLIGGFSFDPRLQIMGAWDHFGDARMVLPESVFAVRGGRTWLTTNRLVDPWSRLDSEAGNEGVSVTIPSPPQVSPEIWEKIVGSVARGIRDGRLGAEKVVLARALQIRQTTPFNIEAALRRLADAYPSCTVFAIAHGDVCFFGASPETLVELHDGSASTNALAGSCPRGQTDEEDSALGDQLLRSPKERAEHAFVVNALHEALGGVCTRMVSDVRPRIEKLPNVQHLLTPVRCRVAPGVSVLDLVERLHPTPAVGGFPRQRALELIRAYEGLERGWYAGPIGWLNGNGDGEFVVGIRSALVRGNSATLFAGCGIVADSDPSAELSESTWKLKPMLTALNDA